MRVTRFAPSPTGWLHAGNALSALLCRQWAQAHGGRLWLRIEDIDFTRCRERYVQGIREDLRWLGLCWDAEMPRQSERASHYDAALRRLRERGLLYPCFCTRADFQRQPPMLGAAWRCPGDCARLDTRSREQHLRTRTPAWRLHREKSMEEAGGVPAWRDVDGIHSACLDHDPVIGRKDIGYSYHLAVVVDDAQQGVTDIVRGIDLQPHTAIHRLLQCLLGYPEPRYHHHPLLREADGQRLAKSHASTPIRRWREQGGSAATLRRELLQVARSWPAWAPLI